MQITIVQAEMETAIRNHILSQIRVADGMEMSIKLVATRGDEGFKAIIDISPSETPASFGTLSTAVPMQSSTAAPAPVAALAPVTTAPAAPVLRPVSFATAPAAVPPPRTPAEVREMLAKEPEPEADESMSQENQAEENSAGTSGGETQAAEGAQDSQNSEGTETPRPAARSLFKGLRKPVNG